MKTEALANICQQAIEVIQPVGDFIREQLGKVSEQEVEVKALNSLVSYVDKTAEEKLVAGLQTLIPEATFLTEEETVETRQGTYQWIIDPLDGTTNFLHQLPFFSISVALRYQEETVLGIVLEVVRGECFYAWKEGGAWLDGQAIRVSNNDQLSEALIATGFPYYDYDHTDAYLAVLKHLMKNTRGIRRYGSAALDLAFTACGRFDAYYEYSLNAWDVAAGALIVKEAGGEVTAFATDKDYLFDGQIIAGSIPIRKELWAIIDKYFTQSLITPTS